MSTDAGSVSAERETAVQIRDLMLSMIDSIEGANPLTLDCYLEVDSIYATANHWELSHVPDESKVRERLNGPELDLSLISIDNLQAYFKERSGGQKLTARWREQVATKRELAGQIRDLMLSMIDSTTGAGPMTADRLGRIDVIHEEADKWERDHLPGEFKARERHGRFLLHEGPASDLGRKFRAVRTFWECLGVCRRFGASVDDVQRLTDLTARAEQVFVQRKQMEEQAKRDKVKVFMDTPDPVQDEPSLDSFDK